MKRIVQALVLVLVAAATAAVAAEDKPELPAALRDWVAWVKAGHEQAGCPLLVGESDESRVCAWPGQLAIAAGDRGAHFSQRWTVYAKSPVPLPGDADNWPQAVRASALAAPVVPDAEGHPVVWLEPGSYALEGTISWARRPESVAVPVQVALVQLSVDGKAVFPLSRDGETLWLGAAQSAPKEANELSLRVFRRLADGVPALLTTRIQLEISGEGREEVLGQPLPKGFVPVSLAGDLNASLDPDGNLRAQLRPGSYALTVVARADAPLARLARGESKPPWPVQEIWSFLADQRLRLALATGAHPIDPGQAGVPGEWAQLPAFLIESGDALTLDERSRGLSPQDQNRLALKRELWLDFDGGNFRARDRVSGRMVRDWRLDVAAPYRLTRAEEAGEGALVTAGARPGLTGVELRNPNLDLSASERIERAGMRLPIAGWQQSFDSVETNLHLPPGYRLYAAPGADRADGAWLELWDLLDVFLVAVAALLAAWLGGRALGALTLAYLVLGFQESGAPVLALLVVIGLALLAKLIPNAGVLSRLLRWSRNLALAALALIALPFIAAQLRLALYPQLEQYSAEATAYDSVSAVSGGVTVPVQRTMLNAPASGNVAAPPPPESAPAGERKSEPLESIEVTGSRIKRAEVESAPRKVAKAQPEAPMRQRYASNTMIQSGAGEPDWNWGNYTLAWSGPVLPAQSVRLVISPPWLTRLTRVALVLLLALVGMRLARAAFGFEPPRLGGAIGAAVFAAILAGGAPLDARADATPSKELLDELGKRVLEAPKCAPNCGHLASAEVGAQGDELRLGLEFHAAEQVGVPLPGAEKLLAVKELKVDGASDPVVHRSEDGSAWIVLARGVHRIDLVFRAAGDEIGLRFPLKPAKLVFSGRDWEANGLTDERLLTDTLELTRVRHEAAGAGASPAQQFPPFVRVTREVELGLDWSVSTEVQRVAPEQGAFSVRLPLLAGERVLSAEFKVENRELVVPLQAGADGASWASQLDRSDTLVLEAPPLAHHAEVWRISAGPMWNLAASGVPAVFPSAISNAWVYEFHPLPGETLTLSIHRPEAVPGGTLALDGVTVSSEIGKRASTHSLDLILRSTQGGQHAIALPPAAEVLEVSVDGAPLNLRPQNGKLSLPVHPGLERAHVRFRDSSEIAAIARTPAIDLGIEASNIRLVLALPFDRWVLRAYGPRVGPAVLYWGELLVMMLVAYGLARIGRTPLRFHHWLLLGLGFSTFSWSALLIVVLWLFALDARGRASRELGANWFNARQLGLLLLTLLAALTIVTSMGQGLLGTPDMHIVGNGSVPTSLRWFQDRTDAALPVASAVSLPMWAYKSAMLAWALWLAYALVAWLRWGFECYAAGGYWRARPPRSRRPESSSAAAAAAPGASAPPDETTPKAP